MKISNRIGNRKVLIILGSLMFFILSIKPFVDAIEASRYSIDSSQLPPWVLTLGASNVDPWGANATLDGLLMSKGLAPSCDVWFVWDTRYWVHHANYAYKTPQITMWHIGSFSYTITGLKRGITYHFRAVAFNGFFYDQGWDLTFTPGRPWVVTLDATPVNQSSATLRGELKDDGDVECKVWFVYDDIPHNFTDEYRFKTNYITMRKGTFSIKIDGLKHSTTYYFRAVASNDAGTAYGEEKNFTTLRDSNSPPYSPSKPEGPIWGKSNKEYLYNTSSIDPDGDRIRYYFDWGDGSGEWTSYFDSGEIASSSHYWMNEGIYEIKVKAQDEYGAESEWSLSLEVTIEDRPPKVYIIHPRDGFYISDRKIISLPFTLVIGKTTVKVNATDEESGVAYVEFYLDEILKFQDTAEPYEWLCQEIFFLRHTLKATAYDNAGNIANDKIRIWKFF